ncbi:helix-turn-helix domain-containing protein [Oceanicella sp. SM1341]|uniref:helix-turn-helix domain-containing protein n=1 Tax=Oceanicella sp. SM1341 TaxID=1548889 RepID=UPI001300A9DA|nr:helix-turn-helix domain-containing protein [Oceanicella sp. SM1341]
MTNSLHFDPADGFVALPVRVLEIEMSPGAFRTLTELCRMANAEGYCWPSLEQLSARLARSRSAISGYVKELRGLGLIDTLTQKMANGYNYRLKFLVTFWADWRASLSIRKRTADAAASATPEPAERSVQPAERRVNSKNQSQENHSLAPVPAAGEVEEVLSEWTELTRGQPFGTFREPASPDLLRRSAALVSTADDTERAPAISADISKRLAALWKRLRVEHGSDELSAQVREIAEARCTDPQLSALVDSISRAWKSHWRRPPAPRQFTGYIEAARAQDPVKSRLRLIEIHLERWNRTQFGLPKGALSNSLSKRGSIALDKTGGMESPSYPRI